MKIEPGATLAHYEIIGLLGRGGMGEVWRARDTRLKREIALKLLPAEMAMNPSTLDRFQLEAEAVARLSHPHIVHVYSVEHENEIRFLTMELIEGESLDQRITPGGLPFDTVFQVGIAVADALAAAHEKHIIHRDLKPANITIGRGGVVKVLDFGLAELTHDDATHDQETDARPPAREGWVIGTVPYMSPEQARGGRLDHRTDIFSLGVVLYELVTGRRPFTGSTLSDLTSSILRDVPPPVAELRPDTPEQLERIIARCLEKEPDRRTQSARDLRNELESLRDEWRLSQGPGRGSGATPDSVPGVHTTLRHAVFGIVLAVAVIVTTILLWMRGTASEPATREADHVATSVSKAEPAIDPHSIAVLPFVNMSADAEQEYFSDGISEELLNLLAKIPELKVAARTSSFSFKGKEAEIEEIARKLHVAHVLEGSVRKSGSQVRITAQLIHASDGFNIWSQTYDRKLDDIFAIQDEIAADVVKELSVTILGAAPKARATDPEAYALYLQASQLARQLTPEALIRSDALFTKVLNIDAQYAPAWLGLAINALNESGVGQLETGAAYTRAKEDLERVLAIDPENATAYAVLAFMAMAEGDLERAARDLERAMEFDPNDPRTIGNAALLLQSLGRPQEALDLLELRVRRDPVNSSALFGLGLGQRYAGRFEDAAASFRAALDLNPGLGVAHYSLGVALLLDGDSKGALTEFEKETSDVWRLLGLALGCHAVGHDDESDAALAQLSKTYEKDWSFNIAYVYAYRGDTDLAFEWLDRAVLHDDFGLYLLGNENLFSNLHSDPRWPKLLQSIGGAPARLARIEFSVPAHPN